MKKVFILFLYLMLCLFCVACEVKENNLLDSDGLTEESTIEAGVESTNSDSEQLLLERDGVKIFYSGITPDVGVGEGINLFVENARDETIIVNMAEVSVNDVMQPVIQPQMPFHITSPGKKSSQSFVFTNKKELGGKIQFKLKVLNENFSEIFVSDFVELEL